MSKYESDKKSWLKSHSFTSAPKPCIATQKKKQLITNASKVALLNIFAIINYAYAPSYAWLIEV